MSSRTMEWRQKNPEKWANYMKQYHAEHKKAGAAADKRYRESHLEQYSSYQKQYYLNNRPKFFAYAKLREAAKLQASPSWLSSEMKRDIQFFYQICPQGFHVDHLYPLRGTTSCGLHVPWNLRLVPASVNLSKKNKLPEEIPV